MRKVFFNFLTIFFLSLFLIINIIFADVKFLNVLIIKTKDLQPVKLTINGFLSEYPSEKCIIVDLKELNNEMLNKADVVIALTSEAAFYLKQNYHKEKINMYALVLMPDTLGILGKFIGFSIYPPFDEIFRDFKIKYPNIKKIGLLYNKKSYAVEIAEQSISKISLTPVLLQVDNFNFKYISKSIADVDAVYFFSDAMILEEENLLFLIKSIKSYNKIIISSQRVLLQYGVDIAYVIDYFQLGKMMASYVKKSSFLNNENTYKIFFPSPFILVTK
ncbi:MAG: ABC transporter substrate binding protein [bacterium]